MHVQKHVKPVLDFTCISRVKSILLTILIEGSVIEMLCFNNNPFV